MKKLHALTLLALLWTAPRTLGDLITGRVLDSNGNPVAGVALTWAGQYTVAGGGFVDLSRAVQGGVGCP